MLEISLQFVKTNDFGNARNVHARELVLKRANRILGKHADSRVLFSRVEGSRNSNHGRLRTRFLGHTLHSESDVNAVIFISQQLVSLLLLGFRVLLEGSHCLSYLFQIKFLGNEGFSLFDLLG